MTQPYELTISQASALMRKRKLSPVELMDSLLARIDVLEPKLRAWAWMDRDMARKNALQRANELARTGPRGSLHGIPIGVKDIYFTRGIPTVAGSRIWANHVPTYDATAIVLLQQAGAIMLGKTVTTEFADGDPAPTINPWDPDCTPGGSSTGSAVAVSVGMVPGALGSQTIGSIIRPAAYNGVVGFKPTYGRLSLHGVAPYAPSFDHPGFLTRSVEDAALLLSVLGRHDRQDPHSANQPAIDYPQILRDIEVVKPRIGFVRSFFLELADSEVRAHVGQVASRLAAAGADVVEAEIGLDFAAAVSAHETMQRVETAKVHESMFVGHESEYGPSLRRIIEEGQRMPSAQYEEAIELRRHAVARVQQAFTQYDALLMPCATSTAPRNLSNTGDRRFQSIWSFVGMPSIAIPSGLSADGLPLAIQLGADMFEEDKLLVLALWCEQVLDVHLTPPT